MLCIRGFLASLLLSAVLFGQEKMMSPNTPSVVAHGEAIVFAKPDQATVQIGVVTQAPTAQAAGSANAKQTADVLAELKKAASGAEIRTTNYSVYPNYSQPKEGRAAAISTYTASNTVEVKTTNMEALGNLIDAAAKVGANSVHGVQFSLKDEQAVRQQALTEAAQKARANAQAMASALGLKIVRIVRVQDGGAGPIVPMQRLAMAEMKSSDATTPMEPGTVQVRATVQVTAEVAP